MDIYDFDGTLYDGDSTVDFVRFCMKRHPKALLTLPRTAWAAVRFMNPITKDKTRFKDALYGFLEAVPDPESEVRAFWEGHRSKIAGPCKPSPGDLVISASPKFLLQGICDEMGLSLIASPVNIRTGRTEGPNCSGAEKVRRFREAYPDVSVDRFYSDSRNDDPMASLAQEAFMVHGGQLEPWPQMAHARKA